jgi:DNA-binding CsgD family transcriptional regulator
MAICNVYAGGIYYAVFRYKFLTIRPSIIADELISNIDEIVFILDWGFKVMTVNKQYQISLNKHEDIIIGKPFCGLIENSDEVKSLLVDIQSGRIKKLAARIIYRRRNEHLVTDSYISGITDSFSDIVGILIISHENKGPAQIRSAYKLTARQFELVELSVSGLSYREIALKLGIAERTVETHMNNIYTKLSISNKIELLHIAYEFNLIPAKPV